MTAWVLMVGWIGWNGTIVVPGIASEAECHRLAEKLNTTSYLAARHYCFPYQTNGAGR